MATVITAPNEVYSVGHETENLKVFVAGGITNCPDWQQEFIQKFDGYEYLTLYNPRRKDFNVDNPYETEVQIAWEYRHLEEADIIVFWFSKGSPNPIVLYELGRYVGEKPILIGIDPGYERTQDVLTQSKLAGYSLDVFTSVEELAEELKKFIIEEEN